MIRLRKGNNELVSKHPIPDAEEFSVQNCNSCLSVPLISAFMLMLVLGVAISQPWRTITHQPSQLVVRSINPPFLICCVSESICCQMAIQWILGGIKSKGSPPRDRRWLSLNQSVRSLFPPPLFRFPSSLFSLCGKQTSVPRQVEQAKLA